MPADPDQTWKDQGACKDTNPDVFFPESPNYLPPEAAALCFECPVFDDCYQFGLTQLHGIWAATTEAERHRIRRQRGIHLPLIEDESEIA